jgi:NAD-dependent dihydropyrimidine dehydrogenase PreA subunit
MDNGIPREEIPWFPRVDANRCNGCGVCITFCHNKVYRERSGKADVVDPYGCVVGCTGCLSQCPAQAISFPSLAEFRDAMRSIRARHGQGVR